MSLDTEALKWYKHSVSVWR